MRYLKLKRVFFVKCVRVQLHDEGVRLHALAEASLGLTCGRVAVGTTHTFWRHCRGRLPKLVRSHVLAKLSNFGRGGARSSEERERTGAVV